jgi:hypothetical protein
MVRSVLVSLLLAACGAGTAKAPASSHADAPAAPVARPDAASAPVAVDRYACALDRDCVTTCGLGAVSAAWLRTAAVTDDCKDGCSSKGLRARCRAGACETVDDGGRFLPSCTRKDAPPRRWDCAVDRDCTATCGLGAVNRAWIAASGAHDTCKDGCADDGMEARCQAGTCVTIDRDRGDALVNGCTRMDAPPPGPYDCVADSDCTATCSRGALNLAWLKASGLTETCVDGCASQAYHARCREGGCETIRYDGQLEASCTRKPLTP